MSDCGPAAVMEAKQDSLRDYLVLEPTITAPLKLIWMKEMRGTIRAFVWKRQIQQRCLYRSPRLHWASHYTHGTGRLLPSACLYAYKRPPGKEFGAHFDCTYASVCPCWTF